MKLYFRSYFRHLSEGQSAYNVYTINSKLGCWAAFVDRVVQKKKKKNHWLVLHTFHETKIIQSLFLWKTKKIFRQAKATRNEMVEY